MGYTHTQFIGEHVADNQDFKWWESIKERLSFYGGITTCIVIDTGFLLIQRLIILGFKLCDDMFRAKGHAEVPAQHAGMSSQHLLETIFDWGTFCIVVFYIVYDIFKISKKLAWRMKHE
jgi:hypothetical protein